MTRLPTPGSDSGTWGDILNDFLSKSHNTDGTLKSNVVTGTTIQDGTILATKLDTSAQAGLTKASTSIQSINSKTPSNGAVSLAATDLTDVTVATPATGHVLTYNATTTKWQNQAPASAPVASVAGKTGAVTLAESDITNLTTDLAAKYTKPTTGIPSTDLASAAQTSLAKADSALQTAPVASVVGQTGAITGAQIASDAALSGMYAPLTEVPGNVVTKTAAYSAHAGDTILCDASGGTFAVTLPTPTAGSRVVIKKIDSSTNVVSITGTVDGSTSASLAYQWGAMDLVADGTSWNRIVRPTTSVLVDYPATTDARYATWGYGATIPDSGQGLYPARSGRPKLVNSSDLISQFESGHGWTGSTGFVANDTSDYITGVQSSKIVTSSSATYKIESPVVALDLTGKQIRIRLKVDDITNVNAVNFWASNSSTDYNNAYKWFIQSTLQGSNQIISGGAGAQQGWCVFVLNVGNAQIIGSPTRTGILRLKAEINRTSSAGEITLHIDEVDLVPESTTLYPNGAVVICFDDTMAESWSNGKPILDLYRYRATNFVIIDQVGKTGRLTSDQLYAMQDQGYEVCGHAYTDADHSTTFTGMTAAQLEADLRAMKSWLRANGFYGDGVAYPLGQYGITTDSVSTHSIVRRYFSYARTTAAGVNKPDATYPVGDPYRIPGLSSVTTYSGGFAPATLLGSGPGSLDAIKAAHGVKVLVFHKVVTGSPGALTEINVTDFQSIIAGINSRAMSVLTLGELVAA